MCGPFPMRSGHVAKQRDLLVVDGRVLQVCEPTEPKEWTGNKCRNKCRGEARQNREAKSNKVRLGREQPQVQSQAQSPSRLEMIIDIIIDIIIIQSANKASSRASSMSRSSICRPCWKRMLQTSTRSTAAHDRRILLRGPAFASQNASFSIQSRRNVQQSAPKQQFAGAQTRGDPSDGAAQVTIAPDDLFHSFSNSPSALIRRRAAFMKLNAYCPHPSHRPNRISDRPEETGRSPVSGAATLPPAHVEYECPDCGIPVACCEEHLADNYEAHLEICDTLREINEDDHDLVSGRFFTEMEYPGRQMDEAQINMTNWDTLMYSRESEAVNDERGMRHVTKLLTYPVTVASVLHELSPYSMRNDGRLTMEGLKSLSALRYTLHPPKDGAGMDMKGIRPNPPPVRLFVLGARAESSLPREVWLQLAYVFPRSTFHLILIGPEAMANRDDEFPLPERTPRNPFGAVVEDRISFQMKISTYVDYFHTMHEAQHFHPYDPYFDAFVLFHPGLGHPASSHEWAETIRPLLDTKVPIICTGYTKWDMERDIKWVKDTVGDEMDILLEPGENRFRSLRWDLNDFDPQDISAGNWGVWAFRGKRYETQTRD